MCIRVRNIDMEMLKFKKFPKQWLWFDELTVKRYFSFNFHPGGKFCGHNIDDTFPHQLIDWLYLLANIWVHTMSPGIVQGTRNKRVNKIDMVPLANTYVLDISSNSTRVPFSIDKAMI